MISCLLVKHKILFYFTETPTTQNKHLKLFGLYSENIRSLFSKYYYYYFVLAILWLYSTNEFSKYDNFVSLFLYLILTILQIWDFFSFHSENITTLFSHNFCLVNFIFYYILLYIILDFFLALFYSENSFL